MNKKVVLKVDAVEFLSSFDETLFFNWLDNLSCIQGYEGRGLSLYLSVDEGSLSEEGLRELIAVFYRYEIDMSSLKVFDMECFASWFRNGSSYWHEKVFG